MKKTLLGLAVAASFGLGAGAAQAAFLAPGSTGSITVTAGCFTFGVCAVDGAVSVRLKLRLISGHEFGAMHDLILLLIYRVPAAVFGRRGA